jgi:16S rRNA (guanine966-N2)-methyltransferase
LTLLGSLGETAAAFVRVISGTLGGRRLVAPRGLRTRPTSDRVREALFMVLGGLDGARVVDFYAGSGALGIEALSRGAGCADFVERDRAARAVLERNLDALGIRERARVWPLELPRGLARLAGVLADADLVLLDPPYGGEEARGMLEALGDPGVLRTGTRVVVEHRARDVLSERYGTLARERERRYGETAVTFYRAVAADTPAAAEETPA